MRTTTPSADAELRDAVLAWCVRRDGPGWSAADETAFQTWLADDPARPVAFARWQAHARALDTLPADAVAHLRARLAIDQASAAVPHPRRRLVPVFATAAVLALAGGAALLAWQHGQARPLYVQAFSTQRGQQTEVPLPDGSRLRLDTATRLEVAYYRQRRTVRLLDGQALFSVQPDAARPFQVQAGPVGVTVVGTRFSVRYTPDLPGATGVQVAVEQGRVQVAGQDHAAGVGLVAGQQVAADAHGALG
ncbi:MAG TPA: FecR domain-containing protein, partial [Pseudorhodoferax sp.]|nr:FecR domain-containing protein [Pseudorhodoferax sp.]